MNLNIMMKVYTGFKDGSQHITVVGVYLNGFLVLLVAGSPIGSVMPMDSTKEAQLDGMLGDPVLELVKDLTAAGQAEASLVQLD